jgi:hypothetical protein
VAQRPVNEVLAMKHVEMLERTALEEREDH